VGALKNVEAKKKKKGRKIKGNKILTQIWKRKRKIMWWRREGVKEED
jgi:hypothetical protein